MKNLTPKDIVRELDRHIIGQDEAKKKVAIALRNRWRRQQLPDDLRDEVAPKNILMIGPTGVGKTEIARRLSKLDDAPFIKVEASKFTEVGYVGRDCESMIRELVETGIKMVREEMQAECGEKARENARKRLIDLLYPGRKGRGGQAFHPLNPSSGDEGPAATSPRTKATRRCAAWSPRSSTRASWRKRRWTSPSASRAARRCPSCSPEAAWRSWA